jgi:hypothetical protein
MGGKATKRQQEALSLRAAGASYSQIADALGISKATAHRLVQRGLPDREPDEQELQLDLVRLDQALVSIWPQVRKGDLAAVNTFVKLTDVRERLRARWYMRGPGVVVNQETTMNQINTSQGVLVIQGDTTENYIEGLRRARGEQAALPAPPTTNGLGVAVRPDLQGAVPGPPGDDALGNAIGDGSVQEPGLANGEVTESGETTNVVNQ